MKFYVSINVIVVLHMFVKYAIIPELYILKYCNFQTVLAKIAIYNAQHIRLRSKVDT